MSENANLKQTKNKAIELFDSQLQGGDFDLKPKTKTFGWKPSSKKSLKGGKKRRSKKAAASGTQKKKSKTGKRKSKK